MKPVKTFHVYYKILVSRKNWLEGNRIAILETTERNARRKARQQLLNMYGPYGWRITSVWNEDKGKIDESR